MKTNLKIKNLGRHNVRNYFDQTVLKSIDSPLVKNGAFNNCLWRLLLKHVVETIRSTGDIQVISPFGFELTKDKAYLSRSLRRFYCYLGFAEANLSVRNEIIKKFMNKLFDVIYEVDEIFFQSIVIKVIEDKFVLLRKDDYQCLQTDKLIDIQVRDTTSILEDYATYIICSLSAIFYAKDEAKEFVSNTRFRNRTYQLYIMHENLFGSSIEKLTDEQTTLMDGLYKRVNNKIDIFFNKNLLNIKADTMDCLIMDSLIKPRVFMMINYLKSFNNLIQLETTSYHVNDSLHIEIGETIYLRAKNYIIDTYLNFI